MRAIEPWTYWNISFSLTLENPFRLFLSNERGSLYYAKEWVFYAVESQRRTASPLKSLVSSKLKFKLLSTIKVLEPKVKRLVMI